MYSLEPKNNFKTNSCLKSDSLLEKSSPGIINNLNLYKQRLDSLDQTTPFDLSYNEKAIPFINSYLGKNKLLISRMMMLKQLYFPLFEQQLDKYGLPLEFKYLPIVESALNPKAKSPSGATGLWQFMYLTGKEFGLDVTSYLDERQDPIKSTEAACQYFVKLYEKFGDWNLVLAAYNGGPGYLQRKINIVNSYNFWDLYPHLRRETRNYVPTFIAVNYVMNYAEAHGIIPDSININTNHKIDTMTIKQGIEIGTMAEIVCLSTETIEYYNPSFNKGFFPEKSIIILPKFAINDFLNNEEANYSFVRMVEEKKILIDEERIIYTAVKGDYLGRIAREFDVRVFEIKQWNNLTNADLDIGDELVLYVKKIKKDDLEINKRKEYTIQHGDTLWDIAKKHKGISVWKLRAVNNLSGDNLKPGTKIIIPII